MREQRRRTRPAVVNKADRPLGDVRHALFRVRDVKHGRFRRSVIGFDVVGRSRRVVLDLLPANARGVMRQGSFLFRDRRVLRRLRLRAFLLRGLLLPRLLRALALLWRLLRLRNGHLLRGRFRGTLRIALAHRRRRSEQHTNSGKDAQVSSHFTPLRMN